MNLPKTILSVAALTMLPSLVIGKETKDTLPPPSAGKTWKLVWHDEFEGYAFYIDGKETWRTKAGGVSQVPEYMLLSDEIATWGGDIRKAKLPDAFLVDYVRVYDLVPKQGDGVRHQ
ncbi:MAG: hypothetical protein WCB27_13385 [Thermoguttaceae bacterium]|jgi:hypothetical protein